MKSAEFWIVSPCSMKTNKLFASSFSSTSLQKHTLLNKNRGRAIAQALAFSSFLLGLIFLPEDGGDMFLRIVGLSPNYASLQRRLP
jgi:hypothetical protein